MPKKKPSSLFRAIEQLQGERPWGRLLDAGTGPQSIGWVTNLDSEEWTAVTASPQMAERVKADADGLARPRDRVLVGNWINDSLLYGEQFDTVLLDYFIGAIEGFSPYWQERMLERLSPLVTGRLYITGVEPYVPFPAATEVGNVVRTIGSLRDASLLLAGERPYREFPVDWILRQLGKAGFRLVDVKRFPIIYREKFINSQLDMCLERAQHFASPAVAEAMVGHVEEVRQHALALANKEDGLRHGADYLIAAEPMSLPEEARSFASQE